MAKAILSVSFPGGKVSGIFVKFPGVFGMMTASCPQAASGASRCSGQNRAIGIGYMTDGRRTLSSGTMYEANARNTAELVQSG